MSNKTKILLYDIETSPIVGTVWGKYEQDLIWVIDDWHMLTFAYKWLDEKQTHVLGLDDFPLFKKEPTNDKELVRKLHELFTEADIVVAHNGNRFDQKKSQARFIYHGMQPPAPYKQIDTRLEAKRHFAFTSNKLDDLGEHLGMGRKLKTDKDLWRNCMAGVPSAWEKMKRYNKKDVVLLEKVYLRLRPWINTHPSRAVIEGIPSACPKCGAKNSLVGQGLRHYTTVSYAQRYQCKVCGGWGRSRRMVRTDVEFVN